MNDHEAALAAQSCDDDIRKILAELDTPEERAKLEAEMLALCDRRERVTRKYVARLRAWQPEDDS